MSGDAVMLRPAAQMQAQMQVQMHNGQPYPVDSNMHSVGPAMPYAQHHSIFNAHHGLPGDPYATNASFTDVDSQMMERDDNEDADSMAGLPPAQKAPSSRTSANNEIEMRSLFQANKHRKLEEVAAELHGNERGPNSERTRQVFAMLW